MVTKEWLEDAMRACEQEKDNLKAKWERQDAVVAFCKLLLSKLEEK